MKELPINKIICGDCIEVMKTFPENSIDTIITDPPYNLTSITKRFGKVGSAPAQYGKDGSFQRLSGGFMGKQWDGTGISFSVELWKECLRVAKPGATLLCFGGTRTFHRLACAIEDAGWIIKDCIMWIHGQGFPKATDISKQLDKRAGKEREVIGITEYPDGSKGRKTAKHFQGESLGGQSKITAPNTPEAQLWNGWKSHGLKPSWEPVLLCMKPNEGSYAENALKWGVAGLNINEARISYQNEQDKKLGQSARPSLTKDTMFPIGGFDRSERSDIQGRFPANLILDEESAHMLDEMSGNSKTKPHDGDGRKLDTQNMGWGFKRLPCELSDSGGASRFFYVAKASRGERNLGCEDFEEKQTTDGCIRSNPESARKYQANSAPRKNSHPTVKPLKLMEYLCILTKTPTGGVILDPFVGSGTTLMAAKKIGRDFIGIEKESEYVSIAEARLKAIPQSLF